ncbi:MAG: hypothetical protein KDA78_00085 [Planctomycetaceae bacterium]|nr:hypothetical protein [Planctomycetaceae bacterium]
MNQSEVIPQGPASPAVIQTASGFFFTCLFLFLLVMVITWGSIYLFPAADSGTHHLVAELSGEGSGATQEFTVGPMWEFRWEHSGHLKTIRWMEGEKEVDLFMEMPGKPIRNQGGVNYERPGTYRFLVEGEGKWTIRVYQF